MQLSVVINTYNRPASLAKCLAAVPLEASDAAGRDYADELVVIDDGGEADLSAIEREHEARGNFRLIRIPHGGRSAARNAGVAASHGQRVLFLGDDVLVQPGCLARHRKERDKLIAVVGPYPWSGIKGSPPFCGWAEPNPQHQIKHAYSAGFRFFATGNLSMDRGMFVELGGFDERYVAYGWEDIDLGLRFERAGGRLIFDRSAKAVHDHPGMTRQALWRREYEMGQTAWQFWSKWQATEGRSIEFARFWDDAAKLKAGPAWRRALGEKMIDALDKYAPASALNVRLYKRMIFSHRLRGVAEAYARERAAKLGARG